MFYVSQQRIRSPSAPPPLVAGESSVFTRAYLQKRERKGERRRIHLSSFAGVTAASRPVCSVWT